MARKIVKKDPFLEREAEKYGNPIPSREFIMQRLEEIGEPISYQELLKVLGLTSEEDLEALRRRLKAMIGDGQIIKNRKECYALVDELSLVSGRVVGSKDGHGFLIPDKSDKRIFLSSKQMQLVFPEDRVLVSLNTTMSGQEEGIIVEILERGTTQIVGRYIEKKGIAFVISSNKYISKEIIIPQDKKKDAKSGQIVVAKIIGYPTREDKDYNVIGEITSILGEHMGPGMEIAIAIRSYNLPHEWSEEVLKEAQDIPKEISVQARHRRKLLQDLPFVTIDGEDARDFDDAICCIPMKQDGWTLYVAIADVGHYVKFNSAIDLEAQKRGNSVYFPEHVVPMLPEILSNEVCSLKPHVERLAMVCEIKITAKGKFISHKFYDAVIKSHARLTYNQAYAMLEGKDNALPEILPHLQSLRDVHHVLLRSRKLRGALEFDSIETKIIFDEHRKIERIVPVERNYAHMIVEECMLAANFCASKYLSDFKIPILYRIHEGPDPEKLKTLREFLKRFRIKITGGNNPSSLDYSKLIASVQGRPDEILLETLILRSLRQAVYSRKNVGHFGLAYEGYVHFTSPIRRYPDLIIHRAIRHVNTYGIKASFIYGQNAINNLGVHCSMTERRADEATRGAIYSLKCSFMKEKVGQTFSGVISNVTNFGVFVALDDIYIEGLLHVTSLTNDYYVFDPMRFTLKGRHSGKTYKLGDKINVLVARVDVEEGEIDFELAH